MLILIIAVLGNQVDPMRGAVPLPGCGELAAYSLLRATGSPVQLSDVSREFRSRPGFDPWSVSIYELRQGLAAFGCQTEAARFRADDLLRLPQPSILYFRPGRWDAREATGHFVVLLGVEGHQLKLAEWSRIDLDVNVQADVKDVVSRWDGEAILLSKTNNDAGVAVWAAVAIMLIVSLAVFLRRKWRFLRVSAMNLTAVLGLLVSAVGCGDRNGAAPAASPPAATLPFQRSVVELGNVRDKELTVAFPFRVGEQSVKITALGRTCSCTLVDEALLNRELLAGQQHELQVRLNADGVAGQTAVKTISVTTDPPSSAPILLAVRYRPIGKPLLSPKELILHSTPEKAAHGQVLVTYYRSATDPAVSIVRDRCRLDGFRLAEVTHKAEVIKSKIPGQLTEVTIDTTALQLEAVTPLGYGEYRSWQEFVLTDGTSQRCQVIVRVTHPFVALLPRVFAGQIEPGENWSVRVPVRHDKQASTVKDCVCDRSDVTVEYQDDVLTIAGKAPTVAGRFFGTVTVSFRSESIPNVSIPVSGFVTDH